MLLNAKIIGMGAAGNKAVIALHKKYPELAKDIVLINSTMKDIPEEYHDISIQLDGEYRGCAKEREVASQMMVDTIQSGHFSYDKDSSECMTIIVTSSEGGTGSGASVMLAKYINQVYHSPIHFVIFTGFEDDVRGMKNTVDLFKELSTEFTVQAISNKKFLSEAGNNRLRAEQLANDKFADNINILLGGTIIKSLQNIDESDMLKLSKTPGFMYIDRVNLSKLKNMEDFNKRLAEVLDDSKSLDVEPTCKRIATILDIKDKNLEFVDYSFDILKKRYGMPFESFSHIQSVHEPEYLDFIVAGLKMPTGDIEEVYNSFREHAKSVDVSEDEFFGKQFVTDTNQFDTLKSKERSQEDIEAAKKDFFKSLNKDKEEKVIEVQQDW